MKCPKCGYIRKPEDPNPGYECPSCGVIYAKCRKAIEDQRHASEATGKEQTSRLNADSGGKISSRDLVCTTCGSVGSFHETRPGSNLVEVVLWLWMIIPGVLYSAWRNSKKSAVCASCNARTLIMVGTPVGRQILQKTSPHMQISDIAPRKRAETEGQKAFGRIGKLVLYFSIFCVAMLSLVLAVSSLSH